MRAVIQRVKNADVRVDKKIVGKIGKGFLIFLGIGKDDTYEEADKLLSKILKLRIFEDENGKINKSLSQVNGELLIVSQFTLYADTSSNRPGFSYAKNPQEAEKIYNYFTTEAKKQVNTVENGIFGADMKVSLLNDGPFTIVLDTDNMSKRK